jgi:hypothetical protein
MLKISLHFATPSGASAENVLGRLDIGYAKLDAKADYKVVMFSSGKGDHSPAKVKEYPRWSASVWDLVARAICQSLHAAEVIPKTDPMRFGKCAFIDDLTAIIEHWPDGLDVRRSTIGTAHIHMNRRRGHYTAMFETDFQGQQAAGEDFWYKPKVMNPWDLLVNAYAWTAHQSFELPARPKLYKPIPFPAGNRSLVSLDTVNEPAYSGILKWLHKRGLPTLTSDLVDGPCVSEVHFVEFLRKAV